MHTILLQEILKDDPWKLMVACILLNQTSRKQVDTIIWSLFATYPNPNKMRQANIDDLASQLKSLGMQNRRAKTLIRYSNEYLTKNWNKPSDLYGIGRYGEESYNIFVLNDMTIQPQDKELKKYMERTQ